MKGCVSVYFVSMLVCQCVWCIVGTTFRRNTCGLKGWSVQIITSSGYRSRNFFRPPYFSLICGDMVFGGLRG